MHKINHTLSLAQKRKLRVRSKLNGTAARPRLSVYRSNKHISVQAIDDQTQKTLFSVTDMTTKEKTGTKTEASEMVAKAAFSHLKKLGITAAIFDRGQYKYHGRVKAVAETLRSLGLEV